MKKIVFVILALLILTIVGFFVWQHWASNTSNNSTQTAVKPDLLTLSELKASKVVNNVQIINEGSPTEQIIVSVLSAQVKDIEGRILRLFKDGATLRIFVDENAVIRVGKILGKFENLKRGDMINLAAVFQKEKPLMVGWLTILRQ